MSYHRPQDAYMHSNASEYDQRYQSGAYRDEPTPGSANQNAADYYTSSPYRSDSPHHMAKGSEVGSHYGDGGGQYDYNQQQSGMYGAAGAGVAGAGAGYGAGYGAGQGAAYKDYSSSAPAGEDEMEQFQQPYHQDYHNTLYGISAAHSNQSFANYQNNDTAPLTAANAQKYSYAPTKKPVSKWIKIGIPVVLILIAIGVGVGLGIGLTQNKHSSAASTSPNGLSGTSSGNESPTVPQFVLDAASAAAKNGGGDDLTYQGTDLYGNPSFKSTADTSAASFSSAQVGNCASDSFSGSTSNLRAHPRIMTTAAQWDCMAAKIQNDAYLTVWNYSIFNNASNWYPLPPTPYVADGGLTGSGILDPAREVQLRVKTFAYAYHLSGNDTKWSDRAWQELYAASGNDTNNVWGNLAPNPGESPNPTQVWNPAHFLDCAELTAAFAIGYDWLYYAWTPQQRTALAWSIVVQGLQNGLQAYNAQSANGFWGWWRSTNGNWNCVCNSGLLLGALALGNEDPTGTVANQIIATAIPNMKGNCMTAVYDDGTWTETPNYWYFGTDGLARAYSALLTATGSDQGLMAANPNWPLTSSFHMYVSGNAGMFFYGDNGPNKFQSNANGMFLWSTVANNPSYALFQRDRADAPGDPLAMFWYDTRTKGGFWNGLPLDQYFGNDEGSWVSMRSSWTDFSGTYIAMKASNGTGHQAHGDLDAGDFVFDALGTRWAGEFGSGNYLSTDYFTSEDNGATRWEYYRKGTQGQNTIVLNKQNQNANCKPVNSFQSTNVTQSADITFTPATTDAAYFITDMSSCYNQTESTVKRGIRFLNGRRQMLLRDEIAASGTNITDINWRVHTNATITLSADKKTATLKIGNLTDVNAYGGDYITGKSTLNVKLPETQTVVITITQGPSNAQFQTITPDNTYLYDQTDPNTVQGEQGNQPNPMITLLYIDVATTQDTTIETLWQPQWPSLSAADKATPANIPLSSWSLSSYN